MLEFIISLTTKPNFYVNVRAKREIYKLEFYDFRITNYPTCYLKEIPRIHADTKCF